MGNYCIHHNWRGIFLAQKLTVENELSLFPVQNRTFAREFA
jgi:hypothetical protein